MSTQLIPYNTNIVTLPKHIDELRIITRKKDIDVLAINKTRMDGTIHIEGYEWVSKNRNRSGGGIGFFIKNTVNFRFGPDLNDADIKILSIEITKNKVKPFLITTWYTPPNNSMDALYKFKHCLKLIGLENK